MRDKNLKHSFFLYLSPEMAIHRKQIIDQSLLEITVNRLCHQLIESHGDFSNSVIIGLQPRGIFLAHRLAKRLEDFSKKAIQLGYLDITFYRDDFRRRETPLKANSTKIDFTIEDKKIILVDDVLFTGRSVRAALDAMNAFGRPKKVELLVLINRKYTRHLPVEPDYVGKSVNTLSSQRVQVEWKDQGFKKDGIWLVNIDE